MGMKGCVAEHRFHPERRWRMDFAFPEQKVCCEIDGGVWLSKHGKKSRHFHGKGAICDMEKQSAAAELGWRVLRYPSIDKVNYEQVKSAVNYKSCHINAQKKDKNIIKNIL